MCNVSNSDSLVMGTEVPPNISSTRASAACCVGHRVGRPVGFRTLGPALRVTHARCLRSELCPRRHHRSSAGPRLHLAQTVTERRSLGPASIASIVVAALMTLVSVAGLADWGRVYPGVEASMLALFVGQDALNLVVGLPILVGSMWLARRGVLIGLLLWPGALFYVLYDYGYYVLGAPFNAFFLLYIALTTLSVYALIGIVVSIDGAVVQARLADAVPARLVGGFLTGIALLFAALWSAMSVSALLSGVQLELVPRVVTILDLTIQLPALFVGGVLLIRRQQLGYVVAAGLLLQAAAYLIGLSALTVLTERS